MSSDTGEDRPSDEVTFAAVEAGDAFVREMRRRSAARDWTRVLREMKRALEQIVASDLVMADPEARAILAAMTETVDMEEFDHLAGRLAGRSALLADAAVARSAAADPAVPTAEPGAPARLPPALVRTGSPLAGGSRGRTLLKL